MVRCSLEFKHGEGWGVGVKNELSAVWFMNLMNQVQNPN